MRDESPAEGAASVRVMNGNAQRTASKARAAKGAERRANNKRALCCRRLALDMRVELGEWDIRAGDPLLLPSAAGSGQKSLGGLLLTNATAGFKYPPANASGTD